MRIVLLLCLLIAGTAFGQKITVAELELKIVPGKTHELLYGFTEGDRIIFSVEESTGNAISEVSVLEYPDTQKYRAYDLKKEKNREFVVNTKSVYKFLFTNATNDLRLCKVKIQRVPINSGTKGFNTAVKWVTIQETGNNSYTKDVVTGYDTLFMQKTRKVTEFQKKYEEVVLDKNQRVSSKATIGENKTSVAFALPANYTAKDETKRVIAWAYWVGVGEESNEYWKQNRKMIVGAVQGVAGIYTSPLGAIAAGAITNLALPTNGEDVEYALANEQAVKLFTEDKPYKSFDKGKGIAAYKRFTDANMLQGRYAVLLANDNYVQPIDVTVKVSAIIEHTKYKDEVYMDRVISPRYEKKVMNEPKITTHTIPVTSDYK